MGALRLAHKNFWLGDGRTVGKLHFDAFDNLLVPLQGRKIVMMMPPYDNDRMGEGHLQESQLKVDARAGVAVPGKLLESTSMVNTPFDLMEANTTMRPAFRADAVFGDRRDFGAAYGNVGTLASTSQP